MDEVRRAEHPRPLLQRKDWLNLNGSWLFCRDDERHGMQFGWQQQLPATAESITVPFPPNSEASGVSGVRTDTSVWYQRNFELPVNWEGRRICLRFGAIDYKCWVFINGILVGEHTGGYSPFGLDIDHALHHGTNTITVRVEDSLSWTQPRGKQAGTTRWPIDYDGIIGIWQTVWLEPLPDVSIESVFAQFLMDSSQLICLVEFSQHVEGELQVDLLMSGELITSAKSSPELRGEARVHLTIEDPLLWSPDSPYLYDLHLTLITASGQRDIATSYCGLREISTEGGTFKLNDKKLYIKGILDQGYFPKGWYTAFSDDDYKKDIELTLAMGFNCVRKHQKAEDPRYLYWADKMGLLVWSEMPSGRIFSTELIQALTNEWQNLVKRDRGHPSIITWVPFNESWGVWNQAERPEQRAFVEGIVGLTHALDKSRPVVGNDGWEFSAGDLWTLHVYEENINLGSRLSELTNDPGSYVNIGEGGLGQRVGALPGSNIANLPILLTECGGIGYGQHGDNDFAYGEIPSSEVELEQRIQAAINVIYDAQDLQGFVWTQLTDVQQEINGLLYFDRSPKIPIKSLKKIFEQPTD